jgi:hypothetical protein
MRPGLLSRPPGRLKRCRRYPLFRGAARAASGMPGRSAALPYAGRLTIAAGGLLQDLTRTAASNALARIAPPCLIWRAIAASLVLTWPNFTNCRPPRYH